jgi:hypothetical protein
LSEKSPGSGINVLKNHGEIHEAMPLNSVQTQIRNTRNVKRLPDERRSRAGTVRFFLMSCSNRPVRS